MVLGFQPGKQENGDKIQLRNLFYLPVRCICRTGIMWCIDHISLPSTTCDSPKFRWQFSPITTLSPTSHRESLASRAISLAQPTTQETWHGLQLGTANCLLSQAVTKKNVAREQILSQEHWLFFKIQSSFFLPWTQRSVTLSTWMCRQEYVSWILWTFPTCPQFSKIHRLDSPKATSQQTLRHKDNCRPRISSQKNRKAQGLSFALMSLMPPTFFSTPNLEYAVQREGRPDTNSVSSSNHHATGGEGIPVQ